MPKPNPPTPAVRNVVVLGAGPTGLTTALLLARAGCRVVVLDRDPERPKGDAEQLWTGWTRPGVSQFRQVHIALPRWHQVMRAELPEVIDAVRHLGGTQVNLLHQYPTQLTGGWQDSDERFATVTARRPVLEAAIGQVAAREPGVTVRRGERVTGLLTRADPTGSRRVAGVRTAESEIRADLVVDACGHRTPVPGWLAPLGLAPVEDRTGDGLVYYTRHYWSPEGAPSGAGGLLTHHESYSVLTLPADNGRWGLAIVVSAGDRATRALRETGCWEAAIRGSGLDPRWLAGAPLEEVRPMAGLQDVVREYAPDGVPVATGLVAVGDALATTSPFLGRGLSLGALQAVALRDAVVDGAAVGAGPVAERYAALLSDRVTPYLQTTIGFGRHRVAAMAAEAAGEPYRTADPSWAGSTALVAGAQHDSALLRAHATIGSMLATPQQLFADQEIRSRLGPWFGSSPYPPHRAGRAALLAAIDRRSLVTTHEGA